MASPNNDKMSPAERRADDTWLLPGTLRVLFRGQHLLLHRHSLISSFTRCKIRSFCLIALILMGSAWCMRTVFSNGLTLFGRIKVQFLGHGLPWWIYKGKPILFLMNPVSMELTA